MGINEFVIISTLVTISDFVLVGVVYSKKNKKDISLAVTFFFSALVVFNYIGSLMAREYFVMSLFSSLYFGNISLMLAHLFLYILSYTGLIKVFSKKFKPLLIVSYISAFVDFVILMINPFKEIAIHYEYQEGFQKALEYVPSTLYKLHLFYCYLMILAAIVVLVFRAIRTPSVYRQKYVVVLVGILFIVVINALFLLFQGKTKYDYSVLFYTFIAFLLYWNRYSYTKHGMLTKVRQTILDEIDQPVFLFDIENYLTMANKVGAAFLNLDEKKEDDFTLQDFSDYCSFSRSITDCEKNIHFQWVPGKGDNQAVYRVDVKKLFDKKGKRCIGTLVVLTDTALERDLITGFYSKNSFENFFRSKESIDIHYPVVVTICDIDKLTQINKICGKKGGDHAIQILAELMKKYFPPESYFARLDDANLLAACSNTSAEEMREYLENLRKELKTAQGFPFELEMQSAIAVASIKNPDVIDAAETANFSLHTKKLMDGNSSHSSLLDSLAQTLNESDSTTRKHVQRTRDMGELLGKRLNFSDIQLSQLALLCLLHDIGKLGIPLDILNKPGKLNSAEWEVMKSHVEKGYRIAKASSELSDIADLILHHHESWNGKGYPDGLKQEAIPLLSRVIAVVDTYDAMTNDRPYHKAVSEREAREEIKRCAGVQFDPVIAHAFLDMLEEIRPLDSLPVEPALNKSNPYEVAAPRGVSEIFSKPSDVEEKDDENVLPIKHAIYRIDDTYEIISVNDEFYELTGYEPEDLKVYHLKQTDLIPPEDLNEYNQKINEILPINNEIYLEHRLLRKDGSIRDVLCYGKMIYDSALRKEVSEIVVFEVTNTKAFGTLKKNERESAKRSAKKWELLIRRDSLTGLLNHESFVNDAEIELSALTQKVVLLLIDIDSFKTFNDTHGHFAGDKMIALVAMLLETSVKDSGFAGRLGGDEFGGIIKMPADTPDAEVELKVKQCFDNIMNTIALQEKPATISMGIAYLEKPGRFADLYQKADKALYRAKEKGKKQYSF